MGVEVAELAGDPEGAFIVLFHGFGADLYDLIPIAGVYRKQPRPTWIFPNGPLDVPIGPHWTGKAWFPLDIEMLQMAIRDRQFDEISKAFPDGLEKARGYAQSLLEELNIPPSKLIIGGFSQGAVLAVDIALHSPHKYAALLILSGTLTKSDEWKKLALLHKGLPFFQSHGIYDPLLPLSKAEELEKLLTGQGLNGHLFAFDGGHEISSSVQHELALFLEKVLDKKNKPL